MCVKGRVNAGVFIDFLKRMIKSTDRKVFLIVNGHPSHKAKKVSKFLELETVTDRLELFYLPPYSPELNPDEFVWNDLKNNSLGRKAIASIEQLKREVISYLRFIQKTPERVRSYFKAPTTEYAAARIILRRLICHFSHEAGRPFGRPARFLVRSDPFQPVWHSTLLSFSPAWAMRSRQSSTSWLAASISLSAAMAASMSPALKLARHSMP